MADLPRSWPARPAGWARVVVAALGELVLPAQCAGCAAPGASWCCACAAALDALCAPGVRPTAPRPCPPGLPPVWAAAPYDDVLRAAVVGWKDGGRRDLAPVLGPVLARALSGGLALDPVLRGTLERAGDRVLLVPVPSSGAARRRRGDAPLEVLLRRAAGLTGVPAEALVVAPALRLRRRVADQSGLGRRQRAANLEHALEVRPRWRATVRGAPCLAVDDVLTTGATLAETVRALRAAGAGHVAVACLAATRRHGIPLGL